MWKNILIVVIQLLASPQKAWKDLHAEEDDHNEFLNNFLYPIFGIIALTTFIGGLWFTRDGNVELGLKNAIIRIVTVYGGYYIASYFLDEMAPRFGLSKNSLRHQQFVVFSSVVLYALLVIMPLISDFFILWLSVLYTVYIVYTGAEIFMQVGEDKRMNFSVSATLLILLVPGLIHVLLTFLIK